MGGSISPTVSRSPRRIKSNQNIGFLLDFSDFFIYGFRRSKGTGLAVNKIDLLLSQKVSIAREKAGLSVQDAATRLGTSVEEWVMIEAGKVFIDAKMLSQIAMELDKPIAWFFDQEPSTVAFPLKNKGG